MDIKIMKNKKNTLFGGALKWILGACAVLMGAQSVQAQCTGTAYIRIPTTWPDVYIYYGDTENEIPATAYDATSDYYIVDLASLTGNTSAYFEVYTTKEGTNLDYPGVLAITSKDYNKVVAGRPEQPTTSPIGIKCPGTGNSIYIMDDPTKPGTTYTGDTPSGAKYFHVLVPDDVEWQGDQIIMQYDGKDTAMSPDPNLCGWVTMVFEHAPTSVILYRKNDPTAQLGLGGLPDADAGKEATPIDLDSYYEMFGVDELYFMPDEEDWPDGQANGWSIVDPGVPEEGDMSRCSFSLAALIYDSDQDLNPVFSSDGSPDLYGAAKGYASGCVGVHHGIVDVNLGADGKPVFSGSTNAVKCFGNEANFKTLFNYTAGKNEVQCYDMPFRHYGTDTRWGYDSDSAVTNDLVGGFSPLEETTDAGVVTVNGVTMGPLKAARKKRAAAGPVPTLPGIFPMKPAGATAVIQDFDHYCNTPGWTGGIDCEGLFDSGDNPADFWCWGNYCDANFKRWGDGSADLPLTKNETRNQQFCFQSHATFVYHEDQEFTFRGDDDIWVFINKKLAVDNGGAHLAAPGHVILKNLNTIYGAGFLEADNTYDLDIFFCDRRTTMSNVIIKTNMYIQQKVAISAKKTAAYTKDNPAYQICYKETGDGSCAAAVTGTDGGVECCGADFGTKAGCIIDIQYYLVNGSTLEYSVAEGAKNGTLLPNQAGVMGGFDLSNPALPVIHKDKLSLGPGKWTLWSVIGGKTKQVYTYRSAGVVDVVYKDAVALDSSDNAAPCNKTTCGFMGIEKANYKLNHFAMGGELIPVYISAMQESGDSLQLLPYDARNLQYSLDFNRILKVYARSATAQAGKDCFEHEGGIVCEMTTTDTRTFGDDGGVDTVYVTVPMELLEQPVETYTIGVKDRPNKDTVKFYLPQIAFVDKKDPDSWKEVGGEDVNDPNFVEYWMGAFYDFNVVIEKPDENLTYYRCEDCSLPLNLTVGTSEGITLSDEEVVFENGFATISLRCIGDACKTYRHATAGDAASVENPATIVLSGGNPAITATYHPIYFREPPVPYVVFADVFDAKGKASAEELRIYQSYQADEYLDGIADSVAIYYDRRIHKDSLPNAICILWDSASAASVNAYKEGLSNIPKDSAAPIKCNTIVNKTQYSCLDVDADGYCANRIEIGGLELSTTVKTAGEGNVISYAQFEDKGKTMKQGFEGHLVDRVAPVVMEAIVLSRKDADGELTGYDNLTVTLSEPVKLVDAANVTSFDFYLNSATSLDSAGRLASATVANANVVSAMGAPVVSVDNGYGKIEVIYYNDPNKPASGVLTPHAGDYLRMGGNIQLPVWTDVASINAYLTDEVQRVTSDAAYNWNSPTGFDEKDRVPSRWVLVTGDAEVGVFDVNFAYTGNAANCETCVEPVTVFAVSSLDGNEQVITSLGGLPGQFVKSDMKALYDKMRMNDVEINIDELYFSYEVEYFTNLGAYVAGKSGKIYCNDDKNYTENGAYFFGGAGHNCTEHGTNFFLAWNMKSDKGREVGTGAYITKMSSYVRINGSKENQKEETSIFGIKKTKAQYPVERVWEDFKKNN